MAGSSAMASIAGQALMSVAMPRSMPQAKQRKKLPTIPVKKTWLSQMISSESKCKNQLSEMEPGASGSDDSVAIRCKPSSLESITNKTHFTKREIQLMYRGFKQGCPNGVVSLQQFREIYTGLFPAGSAHKYATYVFNTFDSDRNGKITFEELVEGLSILSRGTEAEKLNWVFDLYDTRHTGRVSLAEMRDVVQSIHELLGKIDDSNRWIVDDHVKYVFKEMDENSDGYVTRQEFINTCQNNNQIVESLRLFDTQF